MDKTDIFFQLLRIGLGTEIADSHALAVSNKELPLFLDVAFAAKQGVGAFIFDGLQIAIDNGLIPADSISKENKMKLFSNTIQVEQNHRKHGRVIQKLATFYSEHNIRMMVLKGYGLSLLYPKPNHRPCGDVDIWLYGEEKRADRLLHEHKGVEIDLSHYHHTVFHVDGIMIENHYDFLNLSTHLSNKDVEKDLREMLEGDKGAVWETDLGFELPPANFNALFLLRHAGAHFAAEEITLRHVTDWAMFVRHYYEAVDWEWLERTARKHNIHRFLHCLNGICVDYLGLSAELFPKFERNAQLESRVMEDILHPKYYDKSALNEGFIKNYSYRLHRWWNQRWKHRIVYKEGLGMTLLSQICSKLGKPTYNR